MLTNDVNYGINISFTKMIRDKQGKFNWVNVTIKNVINRRKQHLIGTYTNKTHVNNSKARSLFVVKTKNFNYKTIYLAYNSVFDF